MNIKVDHIPVGAIRPAKKINWTTITVHNTGNPESTALNERGWLTNPTNTRIASWNYCIYEDQIIEAIPENEMSYHAGSRVGNETSLGVEICEAGDFEKSVETAVKFIAMKLHSKGKGIEAVKKHKDWSGKNCPRLLIPRWESFIKAIEKELTMISPDVVHWAEKPYQSLLKKGIHIHEKRFNDQITRGEVFALLDRIIK